MRGGRRWGPGVGAVVSACMRGGRRCGRSWAQRVGAGVGAAGRRGWHLGERLAVVLEKLGVNALEGRLAERARSVEDSVRRVCVEHLSVSVRSEAICMQSEAIHSHHAPVWSISVRKKRAESAYLRGRAVVSTCMLSPRVAGAKRPSVARRGRAVVSTCMLSPRVAGAKRPSVALCRRSRPPVNGCV